MLSGARTALGIPQTLTRTGECSYQGRCRLIHSNAGPMTGRSEGPGRSDPTRLRLVFLVAAHEDGEACVCDLTEPLGLTQPTISHHLKILVDAGIFTRDNRGVWAYYALVPSAMDALSAMRSTRDHPVRV
jgi:hypothetical protein